MMEEPGIIPEFIGGLGNQLFIAAAAYVVSKLKNIPVYLFFNPQSNNPHNKFNNNYSKTIFSHFGQYIHLNVTDRRIFEKLQYKRFVQRQSFDPWDPKNVQPGSYLSGYFQYYPPIKQFEEEIRSIILKGIEPYRANVEANVKVDPDSVFLHIRRGDYVPKADYHYLQPIEYYEQCVKQLLSIKSPRKIYVLSDDIDWVKSQPFFTNPLFEIYENANELETLAFMTLCQGGAICANSTFSWWGAFLGAYGKRNPVFVPRRWINEKIWNLFPEEWIVI